MSSDIQKTALKSPTAIREEHKMNPHALYTDSPINILPLLHYCSLFLSQGFEGKLTNHVLLPLTFQCVFPKNGDTLLGNQSYVQLQYI